MRTRVGRCKTGSGSSNERHSAPELYRQRGEAGREVCFSISSTYTQLTKLSFIPFRPAAESQSLNTRRKGPVRPPPPYEFFCRFFIRFLLWSFSLSLHPGPHCLELECRCFGFLFLLRAIDCDMRRCFLSSIVYTFFSFSFVFAISSYVHFFSLFHSDSLFLEIMKYITESVPSLSLSSTLFLYLFTLPPTEALCSRPAGDAHISYARCHPAWKPQTPNASMCINEKGKKITGIK